MHAKLMTGLLLGSAALTGFAPVAMANRGNDCCPYLEIGLTGGWFTTYAGNTAFAIASNGIDDLPSGTLYKVRPKNKFSGGITLNYQMADCCYNWGATYYWYRHKTNRGLSSPTDTIGLVLVPADAVYGTYGNGAFSTLNNRYDFGNVELGSTVCVISDCLSINPKIGISYGRFKQDHSTTYTRVAGFGGVGSGATIDIFSTYKGFGPSIGADVNYMFCEGFALLGNIRYSALVGTLNATNTVTAGPAFVVATQTPSISTHSTRHLANLFQSELGLAYNFDWCGYCGSIVAGYQATKGFDVVERIQSSDDVLQSKVEDQITSAAYYGPFLRLTMRFGM